MAAELNVTMNGQEVIDMLTEASAGLHDLILGELTLAASLTKLTMMKNAPRGATGKLAETIGFKISPKGFLAEIKPTAPYGDAVETGSRPHWPPSYPGSPLAVWARMKGINVYALAASIAVKGTRPHPYIKPTYEEVQPEVGDIFAKGIDGYIRGLVV